MSMATKQHTPPPRRKATSAAPRRVHGTRTAAATSKPHPEQEQAAGGQAASTEPDLEALIELGNEVAAEAVAAKAKPGGEKRLPKTDPEDHLSTYFRDLAVHELLGPEEERELAQGIEDQEIMTWERV